MSETTPITTSEENTTEQPKTQPQTPEPSPPKRKSSRGSSGFAKVLWVLLWIVLALGGFWLWQLLSAQDALLAEQTKANNALANQVERLTLQQERGQAEATQQLASLEEEQARLAERLQELEPKDAEFWRIEEAAELVTQAEQRLVLTKDGDAALRLLQRADALLSKELHSSVLPLREQLLDGIKAMEAFVDYDFTGQWLKLKQWEAQSEVLPLRNREKQVAIPEGEASEHWWERVMSHLPVEVRKPQTDLDVPLTEEAELLAKTLLRGAMQEARLGLLQQQKAIYQSGLDTAKQTLEYYYRTENSQVKQALKEIEALREADVAVNPPELSALVSAFREAAKRGSL